MEVIELASVVGIHATNVGVPILVEELAAAGGETRDEPGGAGRALRRGRPGHAPRATKRSRCR